MNKTLESQSQNSKLTLFDIITIGGAAKDFFFDTREGKIIESKESKSGKLLAFEFGAKIIPEKVTISLGGGAVNAAVSFARLGLKVSTVINLGRGEAGSLIQDSLASEGVDISLITRDKVAHTAMSIIVSTDGERTMFLYRDANENLRIMDWKFLDTEWLYVSSLSGSSVVILEEIATNLTPGNLKLAWNPGSEQIEKGVDNFDDILKRTEILLLNKAEAREFLRTDSEDEEELLKRLSNCGPKIVVITNGLEGSFVYDGKEKYFEAGSDKKAVESTGAGDAFGSTFVAFYMEGKSIAEAMKLASKNAESVISKVGAEEGLLKKDELL